MKTKNDSRLLVYSGRRAISLLLCASVLLACLCLAPGMRKDPIEDDTESRLTSSTGYVQVNAVTACKTVLNKVKLTRSSFSFDMSAQSEELEKSRSLTEVIGIGIFYQDNHQHAHLVLDLPPPASQLSV
jgi:hypothetical protein